MATTWGSIRYTIGSPPFAFDLGRYVRRPRRGRGKNSRRGCINRIDGVSRRRRRAPVHGMIGKGTSSDACRNPWPYITMIGEYSRAPSSLDSRADSVRWFQDGSLSSRPPTYLMMPSSHRPRDETRPVHRARRRRIPSRNQHVHCDLAQPHFNQYPHPRSWHDRGRGTSYNPGGDRLLYFKAAFPSTTLRPKPRAVSKPHADRPRLPSDQMGT